MFINNGSGYHVNGYKNILVKLYRGEGTVCYTLTKDGDESDLYSYYGYNFVMNHTFIISNIAKALNTWLMKKRLKKLS